MGARGEWSGGGSGVRIGRKRKRGVIMRGGNRREIERN
jgi:hypothetical protein